MTRSQLETGFNAIQSSPKDQGILKAIFIRPKVGERESLQSVYVSPEVGVQGDKWIDLDIEAWCLPDGRPDPRLQVTIMNVHVLDLVAGSKDRWSLAGDNLIVDMDLSEENLPVGQRLTIGEVILEVNDVPHTACRDFANRYGSEAFEFINTAEYKPLRLRGLYAHVLQAGTIQIGDLIRKA
jgi:MOSC domain-containing protein YiiM